MTNRTRPSRVMIMKALVSVEQGPDLNRGAFIARRDTVAAMARRGWAIHGLHLPEITPRGVHAIVMESVRLGYVPKVHQGWIDIDHSRALHEDQERNALKNVDAPTMGMVRAAMFSVEKGPDVDVIGGPGEIEHMRRAGWVTKRRSEIGYPFLTLSGLRMVWEKSRGRVGGARVIHPRWVEMAHDEALRVETRRAARA